MSTTRRMRDHRSGSGTHRWSQKQMLLPLPLEHVREISLANHLALVGCGAESGLLHSLNEVIRVAYLSYFLWEAGYGTSKASLFYEVEDALNIAVDRANLTGCWRLENAELELMKRLVALHDEQLSGVSAKNYVAAKRRLETLLKTPRTVSPIKRPNPVAEAKEMAPNPTSR